ncbi:hypothetical protein BGW36DRAFT_13417 [Talaromyces proteolyticus]|uniref:Uncharacterized protein n=1 Tax=Talaromyces proteolyticus TaxID=1131652 RepID=A0AAD4L0S5_9EURO|nr:uncharacterized protein BGW36DRAFT_13417 [Talaromyces proteolyticus]KAH8705437.1 hypothetical protein BGW36DRAFT_13417 [Talaromyces proteolyticus]
MEAAMTSLPEVAVNGTVFLGRRHHRQGWKSIEGRAATPSRSALAQWEARLKFGSAQSSQFCWMFLVCCDVAKRRVQYVTTMAHADRPTEPVQLHLLRLVLVFCVFRHVAQPQPAFRCSNHAANGLHGRDREERRVNRRLPWGQQSPSACPTQPQWAPATVTCSS